MLPNIRPKRVPEGFIWVKIHSCVDFRNESIILVRNVTDRMAPHVSHPFIFHFSYIQIFLTAKHVNESTSTGKDSKNIKGHWKISENQQIYTKQLWFHRIEIQLNRYIVSIPWRIYWKNIWNLFDWKQIENLK